MRSERFSYDLYLCYSAADISIVRPLAERLRGDGLVLCIFDNMFGSDWARPESGPYCFCGSLNNECHFISCALAEIIQKIF
jgi:hypothetical protein